MSSASHSPQSHLGSISDPPPTTSGRTTLAVEFFCPTGSLCGRPFGLELIARVPERPGRRQTRFFLQCTNVYSALEVPQWCAI